MGILKGQMTLRRYSVHGELPDDGVGAIRDAFNKNAFRAAPGVLNQEEVMGWTLQENLMEVDFLEMDRWYIEPYIVAQLRVDKKTLPSKLFQAHLKLEIKKWCAEKDYERCPTNVKNEIKDRLQAEYLSKTHPSVKNVEFCWHVKDGWLIFHSTADGMNDRFLKLFYRSFGLKLSPISPIEFLGDDVNKRRQLNSSGASDLSFGPGAG